MNKLGVRLPLGNEIDLIIEDLTSRLKFKPVVYEVETGEIFRVDAINISNNTFHAVGENEHDWFSIKKFLPVLWRKEKGYSFMTAKNIIENVIVNDGFGMNDEMDIIGFRDGCTLRLDSVVDMVRVLNFKFMDYRRLIDQGFAVDAGKLDKYPFLPVKTKEV